MGKADSLRRLAQACGVQHSYTDNAGQRHRAGRDGLAAVLESLGVPSAPASAEATLREHTRRRRAACVPEVTVAWDGRVELDVRIPDTAAARMAEIRVSPTDTDAPPLRWSGSLESFEVTARDAVDGAPWRTVRVVLADAAPLGYHELELECGGITGRSFLISAPQCLPASASPRWGTFLPLYALHEPESWGIGDTSGLRRLCAWAGSHGADFVGTTPLLAAFLDGPCDYSPYTPISRQFWNEIFVDVTATPEFQASPDAKRIAGSAELVAELDAVRRSEHVDYRRVMAAKRRILSAMCHELGPREAELREFVARRPEVVDYARFRATHERLRRPWCTWPAALAAGRVVPGDFDPAVERYHVYVQMLAEQQLDTTSRAAGEAGVGLYLDLPLGVHPDGYDAWREQELFARKVSVGAPPDAFFTRGQLWGFHPMRPDRLRASRYHHLIAVLRHHLRQAKLLRIDHVMALHRLFWVPHGMSPANGVYVRYPADELYAVLLLEAYRARAEIVGEDLGTVPPEVRAALRRHDLSGMYVGQFRTRTESDPPIECPPSGVLASLDTHDTPKFAAFWHGHDIDDRLELGLLDEDAAAAARVDRAALRRAIERYLRVEGRLPNEADPHSILEALLGWLAASPARAVLVDLEDLWLETRPQNVPGTAHERPNWIRKARLSLPEMRRDPRMSLLLDEIATRRKDR